MSLYVIILLISMSGLAYAAFNYVRVKELSEGSGEMIEIARAIRVGANTFLENEYKVLVLVLVVITILFDVFLSLSCAFAFVLGAVMSGAAGFCGMKMSTYANVRVTDMARRTRDIGKTLKVALRGGSVMGLCVSSFALAGLIIVYIAFEPQLSQMYAIPNWCGIEFVPFSMTLSSYALGCSIIAMFNRVGGGIYTKAADMGADLVGKTEIGIPEDDPRNPAVIADCVGDNVGDTAGLGSDLLESYMGAIVSAIVLAIHLFISFTAKGLNFSQALFERMCMYPVVFCAIGLISCIIGLAYMLRQGDNDANSSQKDPHKELNKVTWISAGLTGVLTFVMTFVFFGFQDLGDLPFKFGWISPWISSAVGIACGILIGMVAEYYTSYDYKPTQNLANSSKEGPAIVITQGIAVGMKSNFLSALLLGSGLMISFAVSGIYGAAMAAVGMLSFVSVTVSVDTYGPISDNAGGIAEMAGLSEDVREITDKLDSVGNTTAAIGKGFAIGSASFAAICLMISFIYSFTPVESDVALNLMNPQVFAGIIIGAAISFYFSGLLIEAVSKSAQKMVDEVRRQFREIVGLKEGKVKPDYKKCIEISTNGAIAEMKLPALISILVPVISGFLLGPEFVGGILIGATIGAIVLAIFCGNSGGAWDNSKKFIESLGRKGSKEHLAAVVGDTVGDPLKDTVGPSLDILIKIMSTISLIAVSFFRDYNLLALLSNLFK